MGENQDNHPPEPNDFSLPGPAGRFVRALVAPIRLVLTLPIWLYQHLVSPALPSHCIYTPSCSEYTRQAILKHGIRGIFVGVLRIGRCAGSLYSGGEDAVPEKLTARYLFGSYRDRWNRRRETRQ